MNIFERIQHGTGLENYCTDILVGILQKNSELLRKFCIEVLKISDIPKDNSLKISSQAHYKGISDDEKKSFVDIQISGTNFLCFLEMKVESSENEGQLTKYHSVLQRLKKEHNNLNIILRFCTKYYEAVKIEENDYFKKLRWYDIHDFFKVFCQDNALINEFSEFLELNMMGNIELVYNENDTLSFYNFYNILKHFNSVLNDVKSNNFDLDIIKETFKTQVSPDLGFYHKRYGFMLKSYVEFKSDYRTACFIGFEFKEDGIYSKIDFWSANETSLIKDFGYKSVDKETDKETHRDKYNNPDIGIVSYKKLNSGTKKSDLTSWFIEELKNIQKNTNSLKNNNQNTFQP